jgi:hypothetical protein
MQRYPGSYERDGSFPPLLKPVTVVVTRSRDSLPPLDRLSVSGSREIWVRRIFRGNEVVAWLGIQADLQGHLPMPISDNLLRETPAAG